MKRAEIKRICEKIKYELELGEHTYHPCTCGRRGCRQDKCWLCYLDDLYYTKKEKIINKNED